MDPRIEINTVVTFSGLPPGTNTEKLAQSVANRIKFKLNPRSIPELRQCALERCQAFFVVSLKNPTRHKFCSNSHRVMACRERKETAAAKG